MIKKQKIRKLVISLSYKRVDNMGSIVFLALSFISAILCLVCLKLFVVFIRVDGAVYNYTRKSAKADLVDSLKGSLKSDECNGRHSLVAAGMAYDKRKRKINVQGAYSAEAIDGIVGS